MNNSEIALSEGKATVKVSGEVDLSWSVDVRDMIIKALNMQDSVEVDLSAVTYIDSSGIAALVEGLQKSKKSHKQFSLTQPSKQVLSVLQLARLDQVFTIND
ncbi:MAG: STAS domain-containing protein [bacterium]